MFPASLLKSGQGRQGIVGDERFDPVTINDHVTDERNPGETELLDPAGLGIGMGYYRVAFHNDIPRCAYSYVLAGKHDEQPAHFLFACILVSTRESEVAIVGE